jgi:hypothetical protein
MVSLTRAGSLVSNIATVTKVWRAESPLQRGFWRYRPDEVFSPTSHCSGFGKTSAVTCGGSWPVPSLLHRQANSFCGLYSYIDLCLFLDCIYRQMQSTPKRDDEGSQLRSNVPIAFQFQKLFLPLFHFRAILLQANEPHCKWLAAVTGEGSSLAPSVNSLKSNSALAAQPSPRLRTERHCHRAARIAPQNQKPEAARAAALDRDEASDCARQTFRKKGAWYYRNRRSTCAGKLGLPMRHQTLRQNRGCGSRRKFLPIHEQMLYLAFVEA